MESLDTRTFTTTPAAPFSFDQVLAFFRAWAGAVLEVISDDGEYRRAVYLEGQPALVTVRGEGSIDAPRLAVTVAADHVNAAIEQAARRTVERVFATTTDLTGLETVFAKDPLLWPVWQRCRGFRPIALPDLFESIVWAITGQQITVAFAAKCKRAMTDRYGERLLVDGHEYVLFPPAANLARLDEADLIALQFSRQKARYILNLARRVVGGDFDIEALWSAPPDEALLLLQGLLGIGRWTAEYVLLRGLGYPDSIPAGDVALQRAIGRAYYGRPASEAEVRLVAEPWAPWRGYAAMCWWNTQMQDRLNAKARL
jgi:DNA-3-methyladenine glycosylase II